MDLVVFVKQRLDLAFGFTEETSMAQNLPRAVLSGLMVLLSVSSAQAYWVRNGCYGGTPVPYYPCPVPYAPVSAVPLGPPPIQVRPVPARALGCSDPRPTLDE